MICGECGHEQDRPFISEFICDNCGFKNFYHADERHFVASGPDMAYMWPMAWSKAYDAGVRRARKIFLVKWFDTPPIIRVAVALVGKRYRGWIRQKIQEVTK